MIKVLFLTEGGDNFGFGHITRCMALSDGFDELGISYELIVRGNKLDILNQFNKKVTNKQWDDLRTIKDLGQKFQVVIVDTYRASNNILNEISSNFKYPFFIIDSAMIAAKNSFLLFPSIYVSEMNCSHLKPRRLIGGVEYLLFGREMWNLPRFEINDSVSTIGIAIGGYLNEGIVKEVITIVETEFPNCQINIYGHYGLMEIAKGDKIVLKGMLNKAQYIEDLYNNDFCVCGAGMSLNECGLIGMPCISISFNESQVMNGQAWFRNVGIQNVNFLDDLWSIELKRGMNDLSDVEKRRNINMKLNSEVDGLGAIRLANEIIKTVTI